MDLNGVKVYDPNYLITLSLYVIKREAFPILDRIFTSVLAQLITSCGKAPRG